MFKTTERKHVWFWLGILFAIIALFMIIIMSTPSAQAANGTTLVRPDPPSLGLKPGDQGLISIRVENADSMYGIEFHLQFDPAVLQVVDADAAKAGVQIQPGTWLKGGFSAVNKADNAAGKIDYAVTLVNPSLPVTGSGTVATITFKATGTGTSSLKIQKAMLATRDGKEIKSEWQDGAIGVSSQGQAPAASQVTRSGESPNGPNTSPNASENAGLSDRESLLFGAAGLGMIVFMGALVFAVVAFLVVRRR